MNPFARHPLRRYAFCWEQLAGGTGRHLDLGCGTGDFLCVVAATIGLECYGADPHAGYLAEVRRRAPDLCVRQISVDGGLDFESGRFDSVSLLDVLEHVR